MNIDCSKPDENYDEEMVEGLQFLSNLKGLEFCGYEGTKFPKWMMRDMAIYLPNLVKVTLSFCRCKKLPFMELLPRLKSLELSYLDEVEYIDDGSRMQPKSESFFVSLEKLILNKLPKLKGWWRQEVVDQNKLFFHRLSSLSIENCKNLRSIPPQPHLKELRIEGANINILRNEQAESKPLSSATSSLGAPLSELETLQIESIEDEELPKETFRNLTSLKRLEVFYCEELKSIPDLGSCTSLRLLRLDGCRKLETLPRGIQNVSELSIWGGTSFDNESLPISIWNATALLSLSLSFMPNLKSLPKLPSSLQKLSIWYCPAIKERVVKSEGEDWPNIKHIPFIKVDDKVIQDERT